MSRRSQIFGWVKLLAPIILSQVPKLAHLADNVAAGLEAAEAIPGASGAEKKQHVLEVVKTAAEGVKESKPEFSVEETVAAADAAIETIFHAAKATDSVHSPDPVVTVPSGV